ncbi:hypothetical protein RSOLAG1IB_12296 [Rhizoctonia solani AG-1 IB]|uniref:Uncharacterized protein n=1 Tax=Thanatephorus cucumeris (strain AG1-IB / isolate 7/3/14) TaxID=1108050 RepID=A0A0B7FQ14_THACB|nr:hypothetical protein RSOLAG1IB_12296 [Rhizoctonia solani AG-1 IB]
MMLPSEPPPITDLKLARQVITRTGREGNGKALEGGVTTKGEGRLTENGRAASGTRKLPDDSTSVAEWAVDALAAAIKDRTSFEQLASGFATPRPTYSVGRDVRSAVISTPSPTSELARPEAAASPVPPDRAQTDTPYQSASERLSAEPGNSTGSRVSYFIVLQTTTRRKMMCVPSPRYAPFPPFPLVESLLVGLCVWGNGVDCV